jgi:hypothetical protein
VSIVQESAEAFILGNFEDAKLCALHHDQEKATKLENNHGTDAPDRGHSLPIQLRRAERRFLSAISFKSGCNPCYMYRMGISQRLYMLLRQHDSHEPNNDDKSELDWPIVLLKDVSRIVG